MMSKNVNKSILNALELESLAEDMCRIIVEHTNELGLELISPYILVVDRHSVVIYNYLQLNESIQIISHYHTKKGWKHMVIDRNNFNDNNNMLNNVFFDSSLFSGINENFVIDLKTVIGQTYKMIHDCS